MGKLTDQARSVIEEGRGAFGPSIEVAERLRNRIREKAAAPSPSEPREEAAPRPSLFSRAWSMNRGLIVAVAAIGLTATLSTTLLSRRPAVEAPQVRSPEPRPLAPEAAVREAPASKPTVPVNELPAPVATGVVPPSADAPVAAKKRPARAGSGDAPAPEADSLEAEMQLIAAAQSGLKSDDRGAVGKSLDEHEGRFPRGLLREERLTLRVRLLCAEGRTEEAKRVARALANEHPRSSHLASLRDSCIAAEGE